MSILFVSDIHLSPTRPERVAAFLALLEYASEQVQNLYILGDLFDQWLGDDDDAPPHPEVIAALARLTLGGVPVLVLHGNHDVLLGQDFEAESGCQLLPDPSIIELYGQRTLISHGDLFCIDDSDYQALRTLTRQPAFQRQFLSLPMSERILQAAALRSRSREAIAGKSESIMDVNPTAVEQALRDSGAHLLIHGHTHRPAEHEHLIDGIRACRLVLGDWYQGESILRCTEAGDRQRLSLQALMD